MRYVSSDRTAQDKVRHLLHCKCQWLEWYSAINVLQTRNISKITTVN